MSTSGRDNPRSAAHPQTKDRAAHFGLIVRRHRTGQRLSQEALAGKAGCSRQSINRVEMAHFSLTLNSAWLLADGLGVRLEDLLREASESLAEQRARERAND